MKKISQFLNLPTAFYIIVCLAFIAVIVSLVFIIFARVVRTRNAEIYQQMERLEEANKQQALAEQKLHTAQQDLQEVINFAPIPILVLDPKSCRIVFGNHACAEFYGFESRVDLTKHCFIELHEEYQPDGQPTEKMARFHIAQAMAADDIYSWDFTVKSIKNIIYQVVISARPLIYNGKSCMIASIQDMSKEVEQKRRLMNAAEREKEANDLKSRFLMNMSHEIRTPMNAIIGLSELSIRRYEDHESMEQFEKIKRSADYLLQIINDILDFSKIEAEKMDLIEEEFNLEETISNTLLIAQEKLEQKQIEIYLDMSTDVPINLVGDRSRVWQILKNLLDNAAKYTKKGYISLAVQQLEEESNENSAVILFKVSDTGMGMNDKQIQMLGTPFEQFHREAKDTGVGTGLGMAITKQLVEMMKGSFAVESAVDMGTSFLIKIPFRRAAENVTLGEKVGSIVPQGSTFILAHSKEESLAAVSVEKLLRLMGAKVQNVTSCEELKLAIDGQADSCGGVIFFDTICHGNTGDLNWMKEKTKDLRCIIINSPNKQIGSRLKEQWQELMILDKPFVPTTLAKLLTRTEAVKSEVTSYEPFHRVKALICEDNEINAEVAEGVLELFGIDSVLAPDGQAGIEQLEQQEFDLVLMDMIMPVLDGPTTAQTIRNSDKPYKDIPIIAMTANVMPQDIQRCMDSGMNAHIGKPIDINELYSKLKIYLSL